MLSKNVASVLVYCIISRVMYLFKGIDATGMKTGKCVISTDKHIPEGTLFEINSFSAIACCSLCLSDDDCESYTFDSATNKCLGFSGRCLNQTTTLTSTAKLYRMQKDNYDDKDRCDDGWEYLGGSCYFFSNFLTDWNNASRNCHDMNAHLAIITSANENEFLVSLGNKLFVKNTDGYWLDGTDVQEEGNWIWNTTGEALKYTDWYPGEPNNEFVAEHCLEINKNILLKWNDSPCAREAFQFICEKEIDYRYCY